MIVDAQTNGTIQLKPGTGYMLFMRAEQYGMTVSKLLAGRDRAYSSLEHALQNTFALAKNKLEKQRGRGKRGRR